MTDNTMVKRKKTKIQPMIYTETLLIVTKKIKG